MDVQIKRATLRDFEEFSRVAQEVHEHHVEVIPGVFKSADVIMPEEVFANLVNGGESDIYVAECEGEIVGYAVLLHRSTARDILVPRKYSFIDNFGVCTSSRRAGVGRLLLEACSVRAKEKGSGSLELDCWEANQGAVRFYESMGLKTKRRWLAMEL